MECVECYYADPIHTYDKSLSAESSFLLFITALLLKYPHCKVEKMSTFSYSVVGLWKNDVKIIEKELHEHDHEQLVACLTCKNQNH